MPSSALRSRTRECVESSIREKFEPNPQPPRPIGVLTGVRRIPGQVRVLLKGLGLKYRKVAPIPAKADPVAQETFLTD